MKELDVLLYNYCLGDDPYIFPLLLTDDIQVELITFKPLALSHFGLFDVGIARKQYIDTFMPALDEEYEIDFFIKALEYMGDDQVDKEEVDNLVLQSINMYLGGSNNWLNLKLTQSKILRHIFEVLDIVQNLDVEQAKRIINNPKYSKHLRISLIVNLVNKGLAVGKEQGFKVRDILEEATVEKYGISKFIFQFIPHDNLLSTISLILSSNNDKKWKDKKELLEFLADTYRREMRLKEFNKSNLILNYLESYKYLQDLVNHSKGKSDKDNLLFMWSNYVGVNQQHVEQAQLIEDVFVRRIYSTALSITMLNSLKDIFFSSLIESVEGARIFGDYFSNYQFISVNSILGLKYKESPMEMILEMIFFAATRKDKIALEIVAANTSKIVNKFPGELETLYPYINRAIEIIFKEDKEIVAMLEKVKSYLNIR